MDLFKFCPHKDARHMIHDRSFRVGTLYGYKEFEEGRSGIGDRLEGVLEYHYDGVLKNVKEFRSRNSAFVATNSSKDGGILTITDGREVLKGPDCYVFCAAHCKSDGDLQRWHDEEPELGIDCCVIIEHAEDFLEKLREQLVAKVYTEEDCRRQRWHHTKVSYGPNPADGFELSSEGLEVSPFYKDVDRFLWQNEYRAAFAPDPSQVGAEKSYLPSDHEILSVPDMLSAPRLVQWLSNVDPDLVNSSDDTDGFLPAPE